MKKIFTWLKKIFLFWRKKKVIAPKLDFRCIRIWLSGQIVNAKVMQENAKTFWVMPLNGQIRQIKRHKIKHVVSI